MLFMLSSKPKPGVARAEMVEQLKHRFDPSTWDLVRDGTLSHVLYKVGEEPGFYAVLSAESAEKAEELVAHTGSHDSVFDIDITPVNQFPHFG